MMSFPTVYVITFKSTAANRLADSILLTLRVLRVFRESSLTRGAFSM
jgi:hypothetical protein